MNLTNEGLRPGLGQALPLFIEWSARAREAAIGQVTHDIPLTTIPDVQHTPKFQFVADTSANEYKLQGNVWVNVDGGTMDNFEIPYSKIHFIAYLLDHWPEVEELRAEMGHTFQQREADKAKAEGAAVDAEKAKEDKAIEDQADQDAARAKKIEDLFH